MTTRKKKRQQEGGGFLKKVSSLFNLDTVNVYFFFSFVYSFIILFTYKFYILLLVHCYLRLPHLRRLIRSIYSTIFVLYLLLIVVRNLMCLTCDVTQFSFGNIISLTSTATWQRLRWGSAVSAGFVLEGSLVPLCSMLISTFMFNNQ